MSLYGQVTGPVNFYTAHHLNKFKSHNFATSNYNIVRSIFSTDSWLILCQSTLQGNPKSLNVTFDLKQKQELLLQNN